MPKVGTAIVELKPVLNEDALAEIVERVSEAFDELADRFAEKLLDAVVSALAEARR